MKYTGCSPPLNLKAAASSCSPNPCAASSDATRCTPATSSSKSLSRTISHSKPNSSPRRSTFECDSCATESSSSWSSFSARTNSAADNGLNTTAASPVGFSPSSVSRVIRAVEIAKSFSCCAFGSFFRPKRTSVRPIISPPAKSWRRSRRSHERARNERCALESTRLDANALERAGVDRAPHLAGDVGEAGEALLERRMRLEELRSILLPAGREDEERVHPGDLAQILLRDLGHPASDLLQRGHQVLGGSGDEC